MRCCPTRGHIRPLNCLYCILQWFLQLYLVYLGFLKVFVWFLHKNKLLLSKTWFFYRNDWIYLTKPSISTDPPPRQALGGGGPPQ